MKGTEFLLDASGTAECSTGSRATDTEMGTETAKRARSHTSDWREQEATNQTIFREMNEWAEEGNDARLGVGHRIDTSVRVFRPSLHRADPAHPSEYEAVRAEPVRFAIVLNHENPEIDRIVEENEWFATVDKFHGVPARIARQTYPRR